MPQPHHIVIGAGSAGSVLAARLSEDRDVQVLLLEAGGRDWHPAIHIPILAGLAYFTKSLNWGYDTEPEPHLDGRSIHWPRGKTLGGSGSINGMMYIRGHRGDYDAWAQMGNTGWDYDSVLPYFKRTEGHKDRRDDYHGASGEWHIQRAYSANPLYHAFFGACEQAGYAHTTDFNGERQEGFNWHDFNIKNGRRHSTARAVLYPARQRNNLRIETRAQARRVLFEGGRAVGVEYAHNGETKTVRCTGEVILCGGAVNSPQLLELSGVGDGERLQDLAVEVTHHLPGVGENLHDHLGIYVQYNCTEPVTMYRWFRPDRAVLMMLQVILLRSGVGASLPLEAGLITRTRAEVDQPDVKISLVPGLSLETTQKGQGRNGFLIHAYQLRPESRGYVHITSPDPLAKPAMCANYLGAETDRICMRAALKIVRNLFAQEAFKPWLGEPISPTAEVQSDDEIDGWIRANANTVFHLVGSCKMGPGTDPTAVVGPDLKVHGLERLRVADASIMPAIMSGNTQAPAVMIAEKAADLLRGRALSG